MKRIIVTGTVLLIAGLSIWAIYTNRLFGNFLETKELSAQIFETQTGYFGRMKKIQKARYFYIYEGVNYEGKFIPTRNFCRQNLGNKIQIKIYKRFPEKSRVTGVFKQKYVTLPCGLQGNYTMSHDNGYSELSLKNSVFELVEFGSGGIKQKVLQGNFWIEGEKMKFKPLKEKQYCYNENGTGRIVEKVFQDEEIEDASKQLIFILKVSSLKYTLTLINFEGEFVFRPRLNEKEKSVF